jgi:hypothetical protein
MPPVESLDNAATTRHCCAAPGSVSQFRRDVAGRATIGA